MYRIAICDDDKEFIDYIKKIGGKVIRIALTKNQSTTRLISKLNKNK